MEEGCPSMQAQLGSDHMADGAQPEPATTTGLQPVNDPQVPDEAANSPSRSAAVSNRESRIKADFEFLWRLRKYLLLLAVLAVSVTYNAGLSPPGGFWTDNSLGHHAGDPLLPVKFFERYEAFFYCNATAFAASLVLIILLLSRGVARQHVWLRSMQVTMILDLFSLMGAYAAGSCRALRSSVYILVLVFAVFLYVWIHILVFIRVVPNGLKEKVHNFLLQIIMKLQTMLNPVLSIFYVSDEQRISQNGHVPEEQSENEQIEEARKFILMLATFAATITYQAGMSPPGGFWAVNKYGYRPGTFVLRKHNLLRFNIFICCNATSFVASLVTVILLLSTELSMHGIRTQALFVCVIADLLGLIGAYAAGCCRDVATSLSVVFIIVVVLICVLILVMFFQSNTVTTWIDKDVKPRFDKVISKLSWPRERQLSNTKQEESQPTHQQDAEQANSDSQPTHQQDAEQANSDWQPTYQQDAEQANSDSQPTHQQDAEQANSDSQPTHQQDAGQANSDSEPTHQQDEEQANLDSQPAHQHDAEQANLDPEPTHQQDAEQANSDPEPTHQQDAEQANSDSQPAHQHDAEQANSGTEVEQPADSQQVAIPMGPCSSTDSLKSIEVTLPVQHSLNQNAASSDLRNIRNDKSIKMQNQNAASNQNELIEEPPKRAYAEQNALPISNQGDNTNNGQGTHHQENSNDYSNRHTDDVRLKKSRTYLLLLAILAVSLTYQAGLNPPGGFWTTNSGNHSAGLNPPGGIWRTNAGNHSAGDPILEDSYHQRFLAFFYFNGTAFAASIVMIIMLLNRKMSNKVIKRRAIQTAMITVLLALMGAFFVGSCREKIKSIYISLVIFFVIAYVPLHVWVYWQIPERWKHWLTKHVWAVFSKKHVHSSGADEKDLERRRNLLLILAVLAATVTYQAGLNPPGGIWPDENSNVGKPGNPVLQDSHRKHYDVFYYSNAVSFVSSVTLIILLLNRESCEHGIKSYALRVCLVAGLLGLLIAYTAGSCRKVKSIIYLIIIAAAVLFCLVIQVCVFSSTEVPLKVWKIFWIKPDSDRSLQSSGRANSGSSTAGSMPPNCEKKKRKGHKYLMLLAILAASIAYQAGLNPPGGFWSDDSSDGHKAGNPVLKDIYFRRYMVFFVFNSISFMASISVILLLLSKSARKKNVPLQALHFIMILDLLALMTAYAAGSCRNVRTSIFVFVVVCGVVVYLMIVIILSSGIAKWLKERKGRWLPCCRCPSHFTAADAQIPEQNV